MSLEIVRAVSAAHPELIQQNLGATCHRHTQLVIERLRAAGHEAYHVCKSPGEGQYTPPGFTARTVTGLDGKIYPCSGVSHDAIWCDGLQFDTLAKANDSETPLFESDGTPMHAVPVWNPIPREFWRPNNPPLKQHAYGPVTPPPLPGSVVPSLPVSTVLPKAEAYIELKALDAFYRAPEGLQRPEGLGDVEAIAQWFFQIVVERVSREQVFAQIRQSDEWRVKHQGDK